MCDNDRKVTSTALAGRMHNPIRAIVDQMKLTPNPELEMIRLSIGDPTIFGNYPVEHSVKAAVIEALQSDKYNGYSPAHGVESARQAVADLVNKDVEEAQKVTCNDVFITNGASGALEILLLSLCEKGRKVLLPRPAFSLYKTLCGVYDIPFDFYNCLPEKNWEVDLADLENKLDAETGAILLCNPSNPTGACFTKTHLAEIVELAEKRGVPIIADEIYAGMVFSDMEFSYTSAVSKSVPVFSVGGIAKRYCAPGWRLGWFVVHNRAGKVTDELRKSLVCMCQRILGPCGPVQGALPKILGDTSQEYYGGLNLKLEKAALGFANALAEAPGITPIAPSGAMYLMCTIDIKNFKNISNDREFCEQLVSQQSVFCLPGSCFDFDDSFRIVITVPDADIARASNRIIQFCKDNYAL